MTPTEDSHMRWTRLTLRSRDERGKLNAVGSQEGWVMDEIVHASKERMFEIVWLTGDGQTKVSYIQDDMLNLDLFFIIGQNHTKVAEKLQEKTDTISKEEALDFAKEAEGQYLINAAYIIAATQGCEFDKQSFDILVQLAKAQSAPARQAVTIAAGYLGWEEFHPLLHTLAEDSDMNVRESAKLVQKHWPMYPVKST